MPYRLENGEAVREGILRSGREQLDTAIRKLTDGVDDDPVSAVHSARKSLKKERSLLRLTRSAIEEDQRRRETAAFREAARKLSGVRDSDVMIQGLDDLAERFAGQVPKRSFAATRRFLVGQRDVQRRQLVKSPATREVVDELRAARLRIDEWRFRSAGWSAVSGGLIRNYGRGRQAFAAARSEPTAENLHAWRKRAKDLWYHLRVLQPIAAHTLRGQAQEAHRLSDLLGDDHDLAVLSDSLEHMRNEIKADVDAVIGLIQHRRAQLQSEAFFVGQRLYAESPNAFRQRMRRYWKAWRAESRAVDARQPAELADSTRALALS
jgi:CHAD domain-containing protein